MRSPTKAYRIFVADPQPLLRKGLCATFVQEGWEIVGESPSGQEALEGICRTQPDIAVLGLDLKGIDGLSVLREIKARSPRVSVFIYTAAPLLENLIKSVEFGASGFLLKDAPEEELVAQIRRIAAGETILDSEWRVSILREIQEKETARENHLHEHPLTPRELAILRAIGKGLTTEELAGAFSLSVHTVNVHIRNILRKLGVSDRTQALVWAARHRLVTFD